MRTCVLLVIAIMISTAMAQDDTASSWSEKGYDLLFQFQYEEALTAFDQAITIDEQNVAAWIGKGSALNVLGNYSGALEAYNRSIEIAPYNPRAWVGKGSAFDNLNKTDESLESYNKAIEMYPAYATAINSTLLWPGGESI